MSDVRTSAEPDLHLHADAIARGAALDFAVNVVAGGPPPWLRHALEAALDDLGAYPDETAAVRAVAERHHRDPAEVVLLNGAAQAFWLLAALAPRHPLCVHPSFTEPEVALRAAGRAPERVVLPEPWTLDPGAIGDDADLVVVGNPTNPTGVLHHRDTLAALTRADRITVIDEAFIDFVPGEHQSLADGAHAAGLPGLVVVRSLTKLHSIPGLRAGYLLAPAELAARLREQRAGWSVNALALAATVACVHRPEYGHAIAGLTARNRADLYARLDAVPGLTVHPGAANYLLAHHPDGAALIDRLRTESVAVRPCRSFPGLTADHFRVAIRDPAAHAELAAALHRATS
jgi:histidinol-phosphate aminotransferase